MKRALFTLLLCSCFVYAPTTLAFEIPYGVQDPMHSIGYPPCEGGEIGFWQVISRASSDRTRQAVYLALTTMDNVEDAATVICYVPADRKVLVMEPGKAL